MAAQIQTLALKTGRARISSGVDSDMAGSALREQFSGGQRGLGLGGRLTDECIAFARAKGYAKLVLWTNANLLAARAIYAKRGFKLMASEPYHGYGHDLVSEHWELDL